MNIVNEVKQKAEGAEDQANKIHIPLTRRLGSVDFVKQVFKQMGDDHMGAFAGNLAYQAIFAMFPFFVFLLSLLGLFHATSLLNSLIAQASSAMPAEAIKILKDVNKSITKSHAEGAFTVGAIIAILAALWGVSGGFRAVMEAMNVMYQVRDSRPFWKKYLISIALALVSSLLLLGALVLVVAGPRIGGAVAGMLGVGAIFQWVWNVLQWPILVAFVLLAFGLIYYFAPDVEQKFKFMSPGALVAVGLWLVFSLLFSLYVNSFGSYNKTYGTFAGIAIFLLYAYYSAFILLLGAEINHIIEEHAPDPKAVDRSASPGGGGTEDRRGNTLDILAANKPSK